MLLSAHRLPFDDGSAADGGPAEFVELQRGEWFTRGRKIFCKLPQLNGSNAFNFTDAEYAYFKPSTRIHRTCPPRHPSDSNPHRIAARITLYDNGTFATT